jgi:DNA-directed RNA polymerase subunit K/omega
MSSKKKVNFENNKKDTTKEIEDDDDTKSQSTDSDVISGSFSQLDEEEEPVVESETESDAESEAESVVEDTAIEGEEELEEELLEEEDAEKVKPKKKKAAKKAVIINNECVYNNIDFEEDYNEKEEKVEDNKRITNNRLTKYEKVRIIGIRSKQIMMGANILVKGTENMTPTEIALLELKHNMIPFKIKRKLPNGRYEIWKLAELEK